MIKLLRFTVWIVYFVFLTGTVSAQFPYTESFKNSTAPGITFGGAPSAFLTAGGSSALGGTPIDAEGNGYLRLTNNTINQKGFIFSNAVFPSTNGLTVEFEYYIYGGGGANGADGISLFLFDATAEPFNIGGFGGSLGYAQITTTTPVSPGVSKGYLAIGLDEFGNFSNPTEGRQGGIGRIPGSVTLRGKGNGDALTPDNYRYLISVQTSSLASSPFGLTVGGSRQPDPTSAGYRRVLMNLLPDPAGGYDITVKITTGGANPETHTVISNYHYTDAAPPTLRYGIASSTGARTNFHEIRNVYIDVYDPNALIKPIAVNDTLFSCQGKEALLDITANDKTQNGGGLISKSSIDLNPSADGIQTDLTVNGKGTFRVNTDGIVVFTPESDFLGTANATYTVKDTYGATSAPATITVIYLDGPGQIDAGQNKVLNISTESTGYTLQASIPPNNKGIWSQVSGPNRAVFADSSLYNSSVTNLIGGTYVFRWTVSTSGGCSVFDDVQIVVNHLPLAENDTVTTSLNTYIPISVLANDSDPDGNTTLNRASISIKGNPSHGTILTDPVTGIINYRPDENFSGYDSFIYTVKDNYDAESNQATVIIAINVKPEGSSDNSYTVSNIPVIIRVLDNDLGRTGATVVQNTDPSNGTIVVNTDGTITYTPAPGFSGKDTFTYRLRNQQNLLSDPITVTVNVRPAGSPDTRSTPVNTAVTIAVKDNDISKTGTTVIPSSNPAHGGIVVNTNGTVTYTPFNNFVGTDVFTYRLRTAESLESDPVTVTVTVSGVPAAAQDIEIEAPANGSTKIDIDVPPGSTIVITDPPKHGTVTVDPVTGEVIYTPDPGYSGPDDFTYIIRDGNGNESAPGRVIITVSRPAKIGLAKGLTALTKNPDGSYSLKFTFTLVNYGDIRIERISLTDDLAGAFPGAAVTVTGISASGDLKVNNGYNGTTDKEMLLPSSFIKPRWKETVDMEATVSPDEQERTFYNSAFTEGYAEGSGTKTEDQSTNGLSPDPVTSEDPAPSELTPVKLIKQPLQIPGGFSPNNDGINDYFVIENTQGKQVSLEVFNRWGNRIYRSPNYKNDWNGKCTEGIHIGDDVPVGTYYYVIVIDNKDKQVGYMTINR